MSVVGSIAKKAGQAVGLIPKVPKASVSAAPITPESVGASPPDQTDSLTEGLSEEEERRRKSRAALFGVSDIGRGALVATSAQGVAGPAPVSRKALLGR